MKVSELIEHLQQYDGEVTVHVAYPSGDYWKTVLAPTVAHVDQGFVKLSNYHDKPALVTDEEAEEELYESGACTIVVLSC